MPRLHKISFDAISSGINVLTNAEVVSKGNYGEYYYKRRRLGPKVASTLLLSLFGVSVVISGQYSLWNVGLKYGFPIMFSSFFLATIMMWMLVCAIAELASLMPFTGGSSNFASLAFGPMTGAIEGYCFYSELLTFSAATMMQISVWICDAVGWSTSFQPLLWLPLLLLCLTFLFDIKAFLKVNAVICTVAILLIIVYLFAMIPFSSDYSSNIISKDKPLYQAGGIFFALPYAIWFYVGIEAIPFLAEEAVSPTKSVPRGLILGMSVLFTLSLAILIMCPGASPGIDIIAEKIYPLEYGVLYNYKIGHYSVSGLSIGFLFLSGHVCSFIACSLGCHRSMYALSRAGLLPSKLSLTIQKRGYGKGAPYLAIIGTSLLTVICASISLAVGDSKGEFLLLLCIAYSLISYTCTFCSFIRLRYVLDNLNRPFTNPFGIPGATIGALISFTSLFSVAFTNQMQYVFTSIAVQLVLSVIY